ncbi:hypothetical protein C8R46DRAFT_1190555 [Mycena filopes]|nr:hypothetical protein C8R46DRAFT_1190555 [Mycena filopes]
MSGSPELSFLASLPTELLHAIARHCETRDLLAFCRANRQLHAVCLEGIYRVIPLDNLADVVKFCKTVISRPETALLVRVFEIRLSPNHASKQFYTLVGSAIASFANLKTLRVESPSIFRSLRDAHLPQLFNCMIPFSAEIDPFILRHSTLSSLEVLQVAPGAELHLPPPPIHMPNLFSFVGPPNLACSLIPQSQTTYISIGWGASTSFAHCLAACSLSKGPVTALVNRCDIWNPDLSSAIVKHMPALQVLALTSLYADTKLLLRAVDNMLPFLPALASLGLFVCSSHSAVQTLDEEFTTVCKWGAVCPNLVCIQFQGVSWIHLRSVTSLRQPIWLRDPENLISVLDHKRAMNASELAYLKWFLRTALTSSELPPGYLEFARLIAGLDGLCAARQVLEKDGDIPDFVLLDSPWGLSFPSDDVNSAPALT